MSVLFQMTGLIALCVFVLVMSLVWLRKLDGSLLTEFGQALSNQYGPKARKLSALWFLLSGVALYIMLLSFVFARDEDFASSPESIRNLIIIGWLGILGAITFLVPWTIWCNKRERQS